MKILHVIFSTNRIKYLLPSLESHRFLDYGDHTVDKLIVDDYPRTRNNSIFEILSKAHNFNLILNEENYGLSVNWSRFFDWLKEKDYDYVLHQEDDVLLLEPVKVDDLIQVLESNEKIASVVLQRQPWYFHETDSVIEPSDVSWGDGKYFYAKNNKTFPIIFSLYRKNVVEYPIREYWNFNINEGMFMVYLDYFHQMYSVNLKNCKGKNIILHTGEESIGKRVLKGEPNYENFAHIDPDIPHNSKNGAKIE